MLSPTVVEIISGARAERAAMQRAKLAPAPVVLTPAQAHAQTRCEPIASMSGAS